MLNKIHFPILLNAVFIKFVNVCAMILDAGSRLASRTVGTGKAAFSMLVSACNRASSIEHRVSSIAAKTLRNLVNKALNSKIKYISLAILLLFIVSCFQDPVNIDLSEFGPTIVIVGNITDRPGPHSVRITRTAKYGQPDNFLSVSGATVRIEDNMGNIIPLQETETGLYRTSSVPGIPGRIYTLTVNVSGDKFTAASTMPQPLFLSKINFEMIAQAPDLYALSCSFQDRAGIEDYCLLNLYLAGNLIDHILYNDHQNDGQEIVFDDFNVLFNYHDVATIDLLTLDKAAYEFFHTLEIVDDREDDEFVSSFIPVTTFNPTTNLDNGALGYFSAHTLRRYIAVAE